MTNAKNICILRDFQSIQILRNTQPFINEYVLATDKLIEDAKMNEWEDIFFLCNNFKQR